ncbi:hypothetical protein [Hyphococcus sp.]|uniref:hypothetical protein n=1 Tax=Hyphococcus sp. TaxID=2038636 RepID=UPI0035C69A4A
MAGGALQINEGDSAAKAVRIPSLPGRQPGAPQVDTECDAYKTGYNAAMAELRGEMAEQKARHETFVNSIGDMIAEMETRYRQEALSLIERLFGAVAPTLAVKSSLADIMHIVEERAQRDHSELSLRTHPSLIAHLSEAEKKVLKETPLVTLKSDESCAPATVDAQWKKGGLYHDPDSFIEDVLKALHEETGGAEGDES